MNDRWSDNLKCVYKDLVLGIGNLRIETKHNFMINIQCIVFGLLRYSLLLLFFFLNTKYMQGLM